MIITNREHEEGTTFEPCVLVSAIDAPSAQTAVSRVSILSFRGAVLVMPVGASLNSLVSPARSEEGVAQRQRPTEPKRAGSILQGAIPTQQAKSRSHRP